MTCVLLAHLLLAFADHPGTTIGDCVELFLHGETQMESHGVNRVTSILFNDNGVYDPLEGCPGSSAVAFSGPWLWVLCFDPETTTGILEEARSFVKMDKVSCSGSIQVVPVDCPGGELFADDFESGELGAWSSSMGDPLPIFSDGFEDGTTKAWSRDAG